MPVRGQGGEKAGGGQLVVGRRNRGVGEVQSQTDPGGLVATRRRSLRRRTRPRRAVAKSPRISSAPSTTQAGSRSTTRTVVARPQQDLDQVGSDESSSAGHQYVTLASVRSSARLRPVIDVILPVLDERAGPARSPGVAARRVPGRRGGQRVDRRVGPTGSRPRGGGGARGPAGLRCRLLRRPHCGRPPTWCASWTATGRSTGRICRPSPGRCWPGRADLVLGRRRGRERGPGRCMPGSPTPASGVALRARHGLKVRDIGPMRAARRQDLIDLGITDRRFGWPLEMVVRAARQAVADHRSRRPVPPAPGPVQGDRHRSGDVEDGARHGGRAALVDHHGGHGDGRMARSPAPDGRHSVVARPPAGRDAQGVDKGRQPERRSAEQ